VLFLIDDKYETNYNFFSLIQFSIEFYTKIFFGRFL
jgi:hypothetical protein